MRTNSRTTQDAHTIAQGRAAARRQRDRPPVLYQTIQRSNAFSRGQCTRRSNSLCDGTYAMRNSEMSPATMTSPYEALKQQRIAWGCALVVGFILIYYGGAPIVPVIVGCSLVPGISAFRSWLRSRNNPPPRT